MIGAVPVLCSWTRKSSAMKSYDFNYSKPETLKVGHRERFQE